MFSKSIYYCQAGIILCMCFLIFAYADTASPSPTFPPMVDPAIDATGPFCYLSKPNTCIGVMGEIKASQVTFDGAIYTGAAELCFFYGSHFKPAMVRQKELYQGWLPIVLYSWEKEGFRYSVETFAADMPETTASRTINFIRVVISNVGSTSSTAYFACATRFSGKDHRFERMKPYSFSPDWIYEITDDSVVRDGKLVYVFSPVGERYAVPDQLYKKPFAGKEYKITDRAEVCLVKYSLDLAPGSSQTIYIKMPLLPVPLEEKEQVARIRSADYDMYRKQTIEFWEALLAQGASISIPEKKVQETYQASLMYDWLALRRQDGYLIQGVNKFQYNHFWLRDGAYIIRTYDLLGYHDIAEQCLEYFLTFQNEDGLFSSQKGQLDGFGQALFALGQHVVMTRDLEFARRVYKHFPPAVEWLKKARAQDEFHLMPATIVRDNEYIQGHYTGHNFWALLGLRMAIIMAAATGHEDDARSFSEEYHDFYSAFMKQLEKVAGAYGYIPPGLDAEGGQDWGNLLGVYPSEVLQPDDPRVTTTLDKMHREKYQEGIMTYMGKLHHYVTTNVTQTHIVRGEQEKALEDFYHLLLHTGSTHEGFEFGAVPWGHRDVGGNYPPHGWCAAKMNAVLRNMLVQDRDGNGGLDQRELHLFSVISPAWDIPGNEVAIRLAPTESGRVSAVLSFREDGGYFTLSANFHKQPACVVLHIPYFVTLNSFTTDAKNTEQKPDRLILSPDVTSVDLKWSKKKVAPMSYEEIVNRYKDEYERRYELYRAAGYEPLPIEAPAMLTAEERQNLFEPRYDEAKAGIAVNKPVTVSGGTESGHGPDLAVDGNAVDEDISSWWAGPPTPRWLQIDLEKTFKIDRIHVYPYWDDGRYYQYTVDVSTDGKEWKQVVDMSKNIRIAIPKGDLHTINPVEARYLRVTMLYNSANSSVHLVEVKVFEVGK